MKPSAKYKKEFRLGSFVYYYDLVKQGRKTFVLTVAPDLSISVKSPHHVNDEMVEAFLRRKWLWLEKQLDFFRKYQRKRYRKEYVSGENLFLLGKQYKLVVNSAKKIGVSLKRNLFIVDAENTHAYFVKKIIRNWYHQKMNQVFLERFTNVVKKFDFEEAPKLVIRTMPKRWGSHFKKGVVFLNPRLIHASKECIDYVLIHEFCHFFYRAHNKNFFDLVEKKCPNWKKIKDKLETIGVETE